MKSNIPFCYTFGFKPEVKNPAGEILKNVFEITLTKRFRDYILTEFAFSNLKEILGEEMIHNIKLFLKKEHPNMPYFYKATEDAVSGIQYNFVVPKPTGRQIEFRSEYLYREEKFLAHLFYCFEVAILSYNEPKIESSGATLFQGIMPFLSLNGSPSLTINCTHQFSMDLSAVVQGHKAEFRDPDVQITEAINSILEPLEKRKQAGVLTKHTKVKLGHQTMNIESFAVFTRESQMYIIIDENDSNETEWQIVTKETDLSVQIIAFLAALGRMFVHV